MHALGHYVALHDAIAYRHTGANPPVALGGNFRIVRKRIAKVVENGGLETFYVTFNVKIERMARLFKVGHLVLFFSNNF